jgi:CRISPR/Cas system CSM-associated protein Csm3 (group 7 of RAMP superfamily)
MTKHYGHADLKDKPYFYTPLPSVIQRIAPSSHAAYQTDKLSGEIVGIIVARSPIHVASGLIVPWADLSQYGDILVEGQPHGLIAAHFRTNDRRAVPASGLKEVLRRAIPASSLKGMVRSIVEAISYSCPEFEIKKKPGKHRGVKVVDISAEHHRCRIDTAQGLENNQLCPACRIFGGISGSGDSKGKGGYLGNIDFSDARQESGDGSIFDRMPLYGPQPSYSQASSRKHTGYKLYFQDSAKTEPLGRKFYKIGIPRPKTSGKYEPVEVCDADSTFGLQIRFDNLTPGELGLLLMALGRSAPETFALKLGGGKPVSLGTFQVSVTGLTRFDTQTAWDKYEPGESLIDDFAKIDEYVQAAHDEGLFYEAGWDKLTQIWRYPPQDSCPGGDDQSY